MGNTVGNRLSLPSLPSKRKASTLYSNTNEPHTDDEIFPSKRRKVTSTSKYIYKTLFEEGQGSDIKIVALNKEWNLHKIYLSQSPYFNSMFNGLWVETTQSEINIGIEDENVTSEALHRVFGSLYQDEIQIESSEAVSVLASATLLQLDDLIVQSVEVMKDSISITTVLQYYEASELYGLKEIKSLCLDWLYKNTVLKIATSPEHLQLISCELMADLIPSPELVVIQTEFSLYLILKQWIFLKENPSFKNYDALPIAVEQYFKRSLDSPPYLSTIIGSVYQKAFRALRLKHLIVHHVDMEVIEADNIIPVDWFMPIFKMQWYQMLRIEQGVDKGPRQVSDEDFKRDCVRCGRVLNTDTQHSWRWTGFNFGFDVVVCYSKGCFKLRRFKLENESHNYYRTTESVSLRSERRHLMYSISVYSLDKSGKTLFKRESNIQTASLTENEQVTVLNLLADVKFPVLVRANFLLTTPMRSCDDSITPMKRTDEYT